jgi:hypothetical protein
MEVTACFLFDVPFSHFFCGSESGVILEEEYGPIIYFKKKKSEK